MASLQEQLLKAGIVDKGKAKQISKEKRKQARQQPKGEAQVNETREQAKRALAEKAERDRRENRARQADAERRAIHAQVIQLVETNTIDRHSGDIAYQFTDHRKIKKIYVTSRQQKELAGGQLGIAALDGAYTLIPRQIAEKIQQREEDVIVLLNTPGGPEPEADDPYAEYQIPDDLMW